MLQHAQITDAHVYMEDNSLAGICKEFSIPEIEVSQIEHETLGSIGVMKLPSRSLASLEGSLTVSHPDPAFLAIVSNPRKAARFQLHSKLDAFDAMGLDEENSTTIITHVTALFHKSAFPAAKTGEAGEYTAEFSVSKLMQREYRSQTPIVEIDLFAGIHKVNGQDVWPS